MTENQKILFIVAIVFTASFFAPLVSMMALMPPIPSMFGSVSNGGSLSMTFSFFEILTTSGKGLLNLKDAKQSQIIYLLAALSFLLMPILTVVIALTKKYVWLISISFPFLILCFSITYTIMSNNLDQSDQMFKLGWGWGGFIISSLILLIMGLIELFKKKA